MTLGRFEQESDRILEEQIQICEIAAPTGQEAERARFVAKRLRALGLDVWSDEVGNVIGRHPHALGEPLVLSAHLDTVFGPEQEAAVARPGEPNPYRPGEIVGPGEYHAPGISDAAAGLAAMLAVARALQASDEARQVCFLATVGEEGRGDLKGARHFCSTALGQSARAFITIDHSDAAAIVHGGIGSQRFRVTYRGEGGHSWAHFGRYNPAFALAAAINRLAEMRGSRDPRTTFNVGVMRSGDTVNAIPELAVMELDLRSESPQQLAELVTEVRGMIEFGHQHERQRRRAGALDPLVQQIGDRPAGATPIESELVSGAQEAISAEGWTPRLISASTDANAAIAAGIPAIALSWGGRSDNQHSIREWFDPTDRSRALRVIMRLLIDLAARSAG